jgi:F-type H+-transporting ATPase subunit b
MRIDWWTLGLQTVNVLIFIWLLGRFFFKPVAAIITERQVATARELAVAHQATAEAARLSEELKTRAAQLEAERDGCVQAAIREADAQKVSILATAHAEADRVRASAEADIARRRALENAEMLRHAQLLAIDITAKLLTHLPPDSHIRGFAKGLAEGIASLPAETRRELLSSGAPLVVKAPHIPSETEAENCRRRLTEALGQPVEVRFQEDAAVLAGLELEAAHAIVRNSLRADLERISAALQT